MPLNHTKIEWVFNPDGSKPGYSANPIKGKCPMGCDYCYAERIRKRFKQPAKISYNYKVLLDILRKRKKPIDTFTAAYPWGIGIFMGSAFELFAPEIVSQHRSWLDAIFIACDECKEHRFYFLTKCPQNYNIFPYIPKHFMLGTTITAERDMWRLEIIKQIGGFVSFEPLLEDLSMYDLRGLSWVIVGAMTGPGAKKFWPEKNWVEKIRTQCVKNNIRLFEKNNLSTIMGTTKLIQQKPF